MNHQSFLRENQRIPCASSCIGVGCARNLHVYPFRRVYFSVSRLALLVWLSAGLVLAGDSGLSRTLQAVEDRYNHAKTLQVAFSEGYTAQNRNRKPETGTLFLRKPGRMRWQYNSPAGKLFLSDGKFVYLITPDTNRVQKMKAKETEDMRAPLAFLLGRLHFEKDFRNFQSRPEGANTWISADPKSPELPYKKVEFEVTADFQIRRVVVTGQDHSILDFHFDQEKLNPPLDGKLFHFQLPPGTMLEEIAN
jgi:outer membrane lipoprotein carrier protein